MTRRLLSDTRVRKGRMSADNNVCQNHRDLENNLAGPSQPGQLKKAYYQ